ncbi:MAG: hypothetical protein KGZ42_02345 [Melioribacter sp.]|nr:hypothetical protein [Melioribacter sp.]
MIKHIITLWTKRNSTIKETYKKALLNYALLLITLSFPILLSLSCENSLEPDLPNKSEISRGILPLKVGYYWIYRDYDLKADGSINEFIPYTEFKYLIKSSSLITVDNASYVVFDRTWKYTNSENYSTSEWLFRNFDNGLYTMGGKMPTDSIFTKLLKYKYPVQKGESWGSPNLVYDLYDRKYLIYDTVKYTCTDTNAVFETPIGSFSCTVYYHREDLDDDVSGKLDIYEYYSKDVGLVGSMTFGYFEDNQKIIPKFKRILISTNVFKN